MITIDSVTIAKNFSIEECMDVMEEMYRKEVLEVNARSQRTVFRTGENSVVLVMPGYSPRLERIAVKIVTEYKDNPRKHSLPIQGGTTLLVNSANAENLAMLDSAAVTAIRTGAVSGLATRLLARKDCRNLGVIGTGQQARSMLEAVLAARNGIDRVRIFSRNRDNVTKFVNETAERWKIKVEGATNPGSAVSGADIVNVATNSAVPVMEWKDVQKGTHINSVGTLPDRRELDADTVSNSTIFVDTKEGVLKDAGDIIAAIKTGEIYASSIKADLSELLLGKIKGRENDSEVTLFKSVGMALQDVYASSRIYEKCLAAKVP